MKNKNNKASFKAYTRGQKETKKESFPKEKEIEPKCIMFTQTLSLGLGNSPFLSVLCVSLNPFI